MNFNSEIKGERVNLYDFVIVNFFLFLIKFHKQFPKVIQCYPFKYINYFY